MNSWKKTISDRTGVLLLGVLLLGSCGEKSPSDTTVQSPERFCLDENFKSGLKAITVSESPILESIPLTGKIESNPDQVVHFISLVSGVVTKTYFSLGEEVKQGQLLAEIISPELNALEAERKSLEAGILVSRRHLISLKSMFDDKIASERDYLEAESQVKSQMAELEKLKSNLLLFQAVPERGVFQVLAPSAGVVILKNVTGGMHIVADDTPLFTIANLRTVWAMVNVYAGNLAQVENGLEANIRTLSYPGEVFQGRISSLSQVFDAEEKVVKGRIVLQNENLRLKPGMVVDVRVSRDRGEQAISVPVSALIFDKDRYHVLIWNDDCDLEVRGVELLYKDNELAYVRAGLAVGERILTTNHLLVYEQIKNQVNS